MSESEYAVILLDYLCDARNHTADKDRRTQATIVTVANTEELAARAKADPLAPTRG